MLNVLADVATKAVASEQRAGIAIVQESVASVGIETADHRDPTGTEHPP